MNEAQNPTSLKERGDKSPNCSRLSWLLTKRTFTSSHQTCRAHETKKAVGNPDGFLLGRRCCVSVRWESSVKEYEMT